jgi:hypothetical protein
MRETAGAVMIFIRHAPHAFRFALASVKRTCLALLGLWNIPALGVIETADTQRARATN